MFTQRFMLRRVAHCSDGCSRWGLAQMRQPPFLFTYKENYKFSNFKIVISGKFCFWISIYFLMLFVASIFSFRAIA